ncbi:coiled-coil domain-containing protein 122 isoform X5 [Xiphophorus hellerii]|uniref:coiled-coil domain-containing protein 122 isoform X5 n=1 Tax=Xiphophorus hellerii TaxID=8084 RepID=UPI0013B45A1A|nr:coiled-coil domain-containing protein 122 isoform X5 [Xiphophorus hellerii]XP_032413067.1 coiled-coil domain-containing protein 122 isoform X5 [Xiphophorus hellerii]
MKLRSQATFGRAALDDIEKEIPHVEHRLRSKWREVRLLDGEMEHLEKQRALLQDRCAGINKENVKLNVLLQDEEESARSALEKFSAYRNKMKGHKDAVLQAVSQTEAHRELTENRMLVLKLRQEKEHLQEDLQNPNGITLQTAKVQNIHKTILKVFGFCKCSSVQEEIDALKREISERKTAIAEGREQLKKEFEIHAKLKRDVEIQTRRYEAIAKRLRCQLSRVQAVHRQTLDEIFHLQKQLTEFKGQQHSSQG